MKQTHFLPILLSMLCTMIIIQGAFANLQCDTLAGVNKVAVLNISAPLNGHAELPTQSNYSVPIYCQITNPSGLLSTNCGVVKKINFLDLSSISNAHVETGEWNPATNPGNYSVDACAGTSNVAWNAFVQVIQDPTKNPTACATLGAGYDCIAAISSLTNGHISLCPQDLPVAQRIRAYDFQICGYIGSAGGSPPPTDIWRVDPFNVGSQITNVPFTVSGTITNLIASDPLYGGSNPVTVTLTITDSVGVTVYTQTLPNQDLEAASTIVNFPGVNLANIGTYTATISVPAAQFTYNHSPGIETILVNNNSSNSFSVNGTGPGQPPGDFMGIISIGINPALPSNLDDVAIDMRVQNYADGYSEYGNDGDGYVGVLICQGTSLIVAPVLNVDYQAVNFDSCNPFCNYTFDIDQTQIPVNTIYDVWGYASENQINSCPNPGNVGYPADGITGIQYTWNSGTVTENYLLNNVSSQSLFIDSGAGGAGAGTGDVFVIRQIDIQGLYEGDDYKATVTFNNLEIAENPTADLDLQLIDKSGTTIYSTSLNGVRTDGPTLTYTIDIDEATLIANNTPLSNNNQPYTVSISIAPGVFNTLPETVLKNNLGFRAMPVLKQSQPFVIPETHEFLMIGILGIVLGIIYINSKKNSQI